MIRCRALRRWETNPEAQSGRARILFFLTAVALFVTACKFDFPFAQSAPDGGEGLDGLGEDAASTPDASVDDRSAVEPGSDAEHPPGDGALPGDATAPSDPPVALTIASPAQRVRAGACSSPILLEARDRNGTASGVGATVAIDLTAQSDARFTFYSDAICQARTTSVEIQRGESTAGFRFRATLAGAANVVVAAPGLDADVQTQIIEGGLPFSLSYVTPPRTAVRGECSEEIVLQVIDQFGNDTVVSSTTTIFLAANPASNFTFYRDALCSVQGSTVRAPPGRGSASFRFIGTRTSDVTITASGLGAPVAQRQSICDNGCSSCGGACCAERCGGGGDCGLGCTGFPSPCSCKLDCSEMSDRCQNDCAGGSRCAIDCAGSNDCVVTCDSGSSCTITCDRSSDCTLIACVGGSDCLLLCGANAQCEFSACTGGTGTSTCAGGAVVCNRACP